MLADGAVDQVLDLLLAHDGRVAIELRRGRSR